MLFYIALLAGVILSYFLVVRFGHANRMQERDGLGTTQTVLGIAVLLIALAWYFNERPDAERVEISLKSELVALSPPYALVRAELHMHNAGISQVSLEDQVALFHVRKVSPFADLTDEQKALRPSDLDHIQDTTVLLGAPKLNDMPDDERFKLWDYTSRHFASELTDEVPLSHDLETGETEVQDYHRVLNVCEYRIVILEAEVPKKRLPYEIFTRDRIWVTNTMLVLDDVFDEDVCTS